MLEQKNYRALFIFFLTLILSLQNIILLPLLLCIIVTNQKMGQIFLEILYKISIATNHRISSFVFLKSKITKGVFLDGKKLAFKLLLNEQGDSKFLTRSSSLHAGIPPTSPATTLVHCQHFFLPVIWVSDISLRLVQP